MHSNPNEYDEAEIIFEPDKKSKKVPLGRTTIMDAAKLLDIDLSAICSERGTCGKCRIRIDSGAENIGPISKSESEHLSEEEMKLDYRLACLARVDGDVTVYVPLRSRLMKQRLQTEGIEVPVDIDPLIKKYYVEMSTPTLADPRADEDRLLHSLQEKHGLSGLELIFGLFCDIPNTLRNSRWGVTITTFKNKIIAVESGDTTSRCFGFAVDIGTTKLAGFLMNLKTGQIVAISTKMNPQIPFGEDIMSRITYVMTEGKHALNELQRAVTRGINEMIDECCTKADVKLDEIYELNFVGNTCMQLLFLRIWPEFVTLSPYTPVITRGVDVDAHNLGLKSHINANAHFNPVIGGFVGADSVADLMAVKMLETEDITMEIDIGTNTEIAIGNRDLVMIDSCASGPAFEGMQTRHGMRASIGAIEKVSIDHRTLEVNYRTIEDQPAVGICGSGLVDALAELLKAGVVDHTGRFISEMAKRTNRLRKKPRGWQFVVAEQADTGTDVDVVITQADIRELQKAKAAIHTGATLLMRRMGIQEEQLAAMYVAGAFGNYMDPDSARIIGMYPEIAIDKIHFVGNTAGTGARMSLISKRLREYAEEVSRKVKYYELAVDPEFQNEYIKSLFLPYKDLDKYPITNELLQRLARVR